VRAAAACAHRPLYGEAPARRDRARRRAGFVVSRWCRDELLTNEESRRSSPCASLAVAGEIAPGGLGRATCVVSDPVAAARPTAIIDR
jgi:hypothetical protein